MTDFPIKKDGLLTFDALSMKVFLKERLTQANIWTDQNYEGSNISTMIDIISYVFNSLMFYLNKTSTESLFSDAQIYENMNRIVKLLDYKPIGYQSAVLSFLMSVDDTLSIGSHTIPRYSYIDINGIPYSFNEDITFSKNTNDEEVLTQLSNQKLLFQGKFEEFPTYVATGQENEIIFMTIGQNTKIDHFNVHVYVKRRGGKWKQWIQTPSLYLENSSSEKFELRFNENKTYEVKFGNNINGSKLNEDDEVAIYYLESMGPEGEVGADTLDGKSMILYSSLRYNQVLADDIDGQYDTLDTLNGITFTNSSPSTYSNKEEDVDSIRQNAPGNFRAQYRLVTQSDYENYIRTNFANIIHDVKVVNNWTYLSEQMKYYYDMGIEKPTAVSRALYNQVMFADSCNFNNVYITIVPKTVTEVLERQQSMLTPSQKSLIIDSIRSSKVLTSETIILDPIYMAFAPAVPIPGETVKLQDVINTKFVIVKDPNSRRNSDSIVADFVNVFQNYFNRENTTLGQEIDVNEITSQILKIKGLKSFHTKRTDTNNKVEGLSMIMWNPIYGNEDSNIINQNTTLEYFKYPYLYDQNNFINWVEVSTEKKSYENVEY